MAGLGNAVSVCVHEEVRRADTTVSIQESVDLARSARGCRGRAGAAGIRARRAVSIGVHEVSC